MRERRRFVGKAFRNACPLSPSSPGSSSRCRPLRVFHLDHPEIGVEPALLARWSSSTSRSGPFGQKIPAPGAAHQVHHPVKRLRLPVERGEFHQHRAGRLVASRDDVDRDALGLEPGEISADPDARGQPAHLLPSLKFEPHLGIALGLFEPAGPHLDLQEQVHLAAEKLFESRRAPPGSPP